MVTVLHLGKSSLPKKPITDDDVDRISLCLKVLSECSPLMNDIFNKECRKSLSHMLTVRLEEEKLSQKVKALVGAAKTPSSILSFANEAAASCPKVTARLPLTAEGVREAERHRAGRRPHLLHAADGQERNDVQGGPVPAQPPGCHGQHSEEGGCRPPRFKTQQGQARL